MKDGRPIVLVTGASGFVGRQLSAMLVRQGWIVRRGVRGPSGSDDEVVIGSLGPATEWSAALTEVDAIAHLAARVHHPNEEHAGDLYRRVNTEATLQLARAAARAGVQRFVYASTVLVNGSCTDGRSPFREADTLAPRGVYGASKAEAETGLEQVADKGPMKVSVVRPPLVYGPSALGNFRHLVRAVKLGIPLPLASIYNRRAFVSVQNLASFICNRLSFEADPCQVYLVADREQVSTPEFVRRIASAMGKRAHLLPIPVKVLEVLLRLSGRPELRDSLIGSMEVDISKALSTGWMPELTIDEGLRMAVGPLAVNIEA
jgi:UDP-glucose 4-epimerase